MIRCDLYGFFRKVGTQMAHNNIHTFLDLVGEILRPDADVTTEKIKAWGQTIKLTFDEGNDTKTKKSLPLGLMPYALWEAALAIRCTDEVLERVKIQKELDEVKGYNLWNKERKLPFQGLVNEEGQLVWGHNPSIPIPAELAGETYYTIFIRTRSPQTKVNEYEQFINQELEYRGEQIVQRERNIYDVTKKISRTTHSFHHFEWLAKRHIKRMDNLEITAWEEDRGGTNEESTISYGIKRAANVLGIQSPAPNKGGRPKKDLLEANKNP